MFQLEVFGDSQLKFVGTNQSKTFTTTLPLLIATYVIVEHQGEAKREEVYELFFPMAPVYPEHFAESSKIIYEKLWEFGKNAQKPSINIKLNELKNFSVSEPVLELKSACQNLKNYGVIENCEILDDKLICCLSSRFQKYLSGFKNDDKAGTVYDEGNKKQKIQKTCSEHLKEIRKFVQDNDANKAYEMVPQGQRGKKDNAFIIRINSNIAELEQALVANDFDKIKAIYRGKFLANIEKNVRVWLSLTLRDWIKKKQQYFSEQVSNTLLNIIRDDKRKAENERLIFLRKIKKFCDDCGLNDESLQCEINKLLIPNDSKDGLEDKNKPESSSFQANIRNLLLKKMEGNCRSQLEKVNLWIKTYVSVFFLNAEHSKESFSVQESHRFSEILFERSYGFMVLLGEAGIGKSLVLYQLAQYLIEESKKDVKKPIPLIFHLADLAMQSSKKDAKKPIASIFPLADLARQSFKCFDKRSKNKLIEPNSPELLEKWLKNELIELGLPEKNIDADFELLLEHCVFFFDGFDNLPLQQRQNSLESINGFIRKHGESDLGGIIIASRCDEYHLAKKQLLENSTVSHRFYIEATIQTVSDKESRAYINLNDISSCHSSLNLLFRLKAFKQLLNTPLGLNLFVENVKTLQIEYHSETDFKTIKNDFISVSIQNCFKRAECYQEKCKKSPYTESQVKRWLGHIAHSMNIGETFLVENLSPTKVLNEKQQRQYQWWFTVIFGIVFGVMMGSVAGLIFGKRIAQSVNNEPVILPNAFMSIHQTLTQLIHNDDLMSKIGLVISYASIGMVCAILMACLTFLLFKRINISIFLGGYLSLSLGITGWLVDGSQWASFPIVLYGLSGIIIGFLINSKHTNALVIELHQSQWNYKRFFKQWRNALWGLLIFGSVLLIPILSLFSLEKFNFYIILLQVFVMSAGITLAYIFYRLKMYADWHPQDFLPRQKIIATLKRSLLMTFLVGGLTTFLVTILSVLSSNLGLAGSLSFGLRVGMPIGIVTGFILYGGIEVLKHITLRLFMYRYQIAPWHYTRFLEYAKQFMFLKPQSSGYAFRHDWFQEYFQDLSSNSSPKNKC